ncbi:MAG: RcsF lipoprotein [Pseudomonadota bacterium]|jgi:hypothetical protein
MHYLREKLKFIGALGTVFLSGCGSFVPTVSISNLSEDQRHKIRQVEIFNSTQIQNKEFKVLTIVEGNSCQNKLYDPPATRANAIEQLKFHSLEHGGDGITNIQCSGREGTSLRTNCWELISCTAEVIKFKSK